MIGQWVRMTAILMISAFGMSCVVTKPKAQIDSSPSTEIQDIRVIEENGKMTIEVLGEEPMIYTTFHLTDPDRLVIDMAGVSLGRFNEEIQMETGPVRVIRPAQGGGDNVARLEFLLDDSVEAEVKTEGMNLVIEVAESEPMKSQFTALEADEMEQEIVSPPSAEKGMEIPAAGLGLEAAPAALAVTESPGEGALNSMGSSLADSIGTSAKAGSTQMMEKPASESLEKAGAGSPGQIADPPALVPLVSDSPNEETLESTEPVENEASLVEEKMSAPKATVTKTTLMDEASFAEETIPLPPASRVKSIHWVHGQELQLVVTADGVLSPNLFFVDSQRLVIDLPGVRAQRRLTKIASEDVHIKQVRIGQHEKKLRLVVDLNAPIHYAWELDQNQLKVTLTAKAAKEDLPSSSEETKSQVVKQSPSVVNPIADAPAEVASPSGADAASTALAQSKAMQSPSVNTPETGALPSLPPSLPTGTSEKSTPGIEDESLKEADEEQAVQVADLSKKDSARKKTFLKRLRQKEASENLTSLSTPKIEELEVEQASLTEGYVGKKISLDFQDAEITNVIRLIAEVSGLNFVMADDVSGKVTLKLNDVPWDQALDIILEMHNLGKDREGNIIRVATLANLAKQRDEEARAKETKVKAEDLLTRVIYVNYAKADAMKTLLTKLLSPRGEIMVDTRTNALIVKDIKDNLKEVERLSSRMDTKTPQVLIEARIAEVKPVFLRSLGIKWGAGYNATSNGNLVGIGNPLATSPINAGVPDFAVNLPASTSLGGIGFTFGRFTQNPFTLDLRLSAGETQALTRVVSTPKVMVLDNHEALIEQGESVPFSTVSQEGTQVQFIDANLTLKVTPHISPDGGILLDVHLSKNEAGPVSPGAPGPPIFKKEVTTNVLLMDGETMVIGGIYETTKTESESGIPWLKDIPFIGWLFKNKETREDTSELLVFLTPKVMD